MACSFSFILSQPPETSLLLFHFVQEKPGIKDEPHAQPLQFKGGRIEFENVHFG